VEKPVPVPTRENSKCAAEDNLLLAQLRREELRTFLAASEKVLIPARAALYAQGDRIRHVYFFTSGMASGSAVMQDGRSAEVTSVGREGFLGLPVLLDGSISLHRCWMQIAGAACRVEAGELRRLLEVIPGLAEALPHYAYARMFETTQLVACNVLHTVEQRLCRWLLLARHRTGEDELAITHELLADSLGAQRTTVSLVAGSLERAGLISYKRGHIRITNLKRLEAASCECFRVIRDRYGMLLGGR
jgi:CRP-like cAMP-binding protein